MSFLIPDINTFFLLHTHFFSLLVYHVPILSCNSTVYTLCTVSTWGSVYICQNQLWFCDQRSCNCCPLLLSPRHLIWIFVQQMCDAKLLCNRAKSAFHLRIFFPCQYKRKENIVSQRKRIQQIKILKYKAQILSSECSHLTFFDRS